MHNYVTNLCIVLYCNFFGVLTTPCMGLSVFCLPSINNNNNNVIFIGGNTETFDGCDATGALVAVVMHFVYIIYTLYCGVLHCNPVNTGASLVKRVRRKRVSLMGNTHP